MKILIIYGSVFGNTEKAALAMQDALSSESTVETHRASNASTAQWARKVMT